MNILAGFLRAIRGGGSAAAPASPSDQILVVDAQTLAAMRRNSPRVSPRDQVDALNELVRMAKREGVTLVAVLEGEPLREVANGGTYQGLLVYYSPTSADIPATMVRVYKEQSRRKRTVVICGDRNTENAARAAGAECMRLSTFRRGFDEVREGGGEGQGRDRGERRRGPPQQRERRRRPDGEAQDAQAESAPEDNDAPDDQNGEDGSDENRTPRQSERSSGNKPKSDVADLIDLV